jgi:DNA-binding transcriptional ArsR family regulator
MFSMDPEVLSVLASQRRRRILQLVHDNEMAAGELASHFDVSWSAISQHLGVLKDAHLVRERRDGRRRLYSTDAEMLGPLEAMLTAMWRTDLDRLAELAENEDASR